MTGLYVSVPITCWRKGHAREFLETEPVPPPSTLYGFLLSMVGEVDRRAHIGARVTGGVIEAPPISRVLRTVWRIKSKKTAMGVGQNARPDWQELFTGAEVVVFVSSEEEEGPGLEERLVRAIEDPATVQRFGGLSLGESTHLVDVVRLLREEDLERRPEIFVADEAGDRSMPVWVDHVGSLGTRHAVGRLATRSTAPEPEEVPVIAPQERS